MVDSARRLLPSSAKFLCFNRAVSPEGRLIAANCNRCLKFPCGARLRLRRRRRRRRSSSSSSYSRRSRSQVSDPVVCEHTRAQTQTHPRREFFANCVRDAHHRRAVAHARAAAESAQVALAPRIPEAYEEKCHDYVPEVTPRNTQTTGGNWWFARAYRRAVSQNSERTVPTRNARERAHPTSQGEQKVKTT